MDNLSPGSGQVPPHLAGVVPSSLGRRALARLVDLLIVLLAQGIPWGLLLLFDFPHRVPLWVFVVSVALMLVLMLIPIIMLMVTGWTPGGYAMGIRQIRFSTGDNPGAAALGKYLLFSLLTAVTLTVAAWIIWFGTRDSLGRCWHDRIGNIWVIDVRLGRDPIKQPAPPPMPPRMVPGLIGPGVQVDNWYHSKPEPLIPESDTDMWRLPSRPLTTLPDPEQLWGPNHGANPDVAPMETGPAMVAIHTPHAPAHVPAQAEYEDGTVSKIPAGSVRLTFDDGSIQYARSSVVLGRDPVPDAAHPNAERITVRDPDRTISKTHLVMTVHGDSVVVEDLNSTNGTVVVAPNGERSAALPGTPIWAGAGSTVEFGERSVRIGV